MKYLLTILIIIFSISLSYAQFPIDAQTGSVVYTEVIELTGMTKETIYDKVKFWIVTTLKSGDNMVELDGSNSEQIVGTGNLVIPGIYQLHPKNQDWPGTNLNFKFVVFIKEGKLKYSIENFLFSLPQSGTRLTMQLSNIETPKYDVNGKWKEHWKINTEEMIAAEITKLVESFKTSMKTETTQDW